uniref:Uncharacterized protein n=1 Tax=Chromera velia CCMP2878 TaxID=1169474 RepID=A0A0G4HD28_9ALVE|eukprot:Cvel_26421.t1-p1 / transcript=Cvel_26421.t1 / gene=Cvel_26421 / organism=Chromera_velia_CCMP2878 / gene_product=hypothetical protein / transcript_product=hypothetical protein / location=Cvel_scaffold3137:1004-1291(-) / protein_length=96 / sequence_SO=supercontig / SO=protein_coding / is_pseudo=false
MFSVVDGKEITAEMVQKLIEWERQKSKRKPKNPFHSLTKQLRQPEVFLLIVWWLALLVLVVWVSGLSHVLWRSWRPLAFLSVIPLFFLGLVAFIAS